MRPLHWQMPFEWRRFCCLGGTAPDFVMIKPHLLQIKLTSISKTSDIGCGWYSIFIVGIDVRGHIGISTLQNLAYKGPGGSAIKWP